MGVFEVVKHLGNDAPVAIIDDDTAGMSPGATGQMSPGTTGQMVPTTQPATTSDGTWEELSLPQSGYPQCRQLAMDPADSSVLYAVTDVGLFVSRDGAATWAQQEEFGSQAYELFVDPGPPAVVYVGLAENGDIRFAKTTDGGITWEDAAVLNAAVGNRMLLAAFGSVLYVRDFARDGTDVIAKTSDGGSSWETLALPDYAASKGYVFSLRADPRDPSRLYLYSPAVQFLENLTAPGSVEVVAFVSKDGAQTWSRLRGEELDWARAVAVAAPATTAEAIAGVSAFLKAAWESQEYGTNTTTGAPFSLSQSSTLVAVDPTDASTLYVGTDTGIYKSTDQGQTWNDTSAALRTRPEVHAVVVDPASPGTLYVTTDAGIIKYTDEGLSWTSLFRTSAGWSSLAVAPSSPSTLYAWGSAGLSRSDDGGATWTAPAGVGLPSLEPGQEPVWDLLVSSESPNALLANTVGGVFRSTDGGDTWQRPSGLPEKARGDQELTYGFPLDDRSLLYQVRSDPSVFYAVLADRTSGFTIALFTSSDGGETWSLLASLGEANRAYLPFVLDTSGPLTVYAQIANFTFLEDGHIDGIGTDAVFRRSTDAGASWTEISNEGLGAFFDLWVDEWAGDTLYTLARPMGAEQSVHRSTDKGDSWQELCTASGVRSLVPGPGGVLYGIGERTVFKWAPGTH
ncbi:MAG: exo-alpha-sialidase [Thermoleophilia bacterium]|nr:exo-alpha-sialidase [Thermoleophilia bacterium]